MRRIPITAFIAGLAIIFVVTGWRLYAKNESVRFAAVDAVRNSKSYVRLRLAISYPRGRIASEQYTLIDDNGRSFAAYAVGDRKGTIATFHEDLRGYDVTFAFEKIVQDGIWQLDSKRPRTPDDPRYVVSIQQTAQGESGGRTVSFADPRYWAVAAGRQYHITLDSHKPVPSQADLLKLQSTSLADPRYEEIVKDFETFGSPQFHRTIAAAREKLLKS